MCATGFIHRTCNALMRISSSLSSLKVQNSTSMGTSETSYDERRGCRLQENVARSRIMYALHICATDNCGCNRAVILRKRPPGHVSKDDRRAPSVSSQLPSGRPRPRGFKVARTRKPEAGQQRATSSRAFTWLTLAARGALRLPNGPMTVSPSFLTSSRRLRGFSRHRPPTTCERTDLRLSQGYAFN